MDFHKPGLCRRRKKDDHTKNACDNYNVFVPIHVIPFLQNHVQNPTPSPALGLGTIQSTSFSANIYDFDYICLYL